MKTDPTLMFRMVLGSILLVLTGAACNRNTAHTSVEAQQYDQVSVVATILEDQVLVRVENGSKENTVLADEPLIGFGRGGPRVGIILRDRKGTISPCAHLDPPRYARPPVILEPGQVVTKKVSLDLVRKVYCLEPGRYRLQATYSSDVAPSITGPEVALEIEALR